MKKFIRFRVRRVLMHFICYMPFNIYSWILLPSKGADGEIIKKMQHLRNSPTSWTKLVTCGNIFKDTIDPQENFFLTDYSERNRSINEWKGCKLIMCYPEKTIFRLSSHFKWMNRVSNLTAQIKLLHNLNLEGLVSKILWGFFHILGSYKTMDQQETEPAEPPEPVYFFF